MVSLRSFGMVLKGKSGVNQPIAVVRGHRVPMVGRTRKSEFETEFAICQLTLTKLPFDAVYCSVYVVIFSFFLPLTSLKAMG